MNNKLNAISTFLRVAEAGSFSAAARLAGIKQSAVSQQIAALEEELGVVLLHRTTRRMKLTAQGERYRRDMQLVLEAMQEAERRLNPVEHQYQGAVHVQLPSGLGQIVLPRLLTLQRMNPELHLQVSLDDRIADLVTEGVDVALRLSAEPPQAHAARVLARIETPLFAAPSFPPVESVYALAALPHVRFSGIPLDAPLRLVSDDETIDIAVNTVSAPIPATPCYRRWRQAWVLAVCSYRSRHGRCKPARWCRYSPRGGYPTAFSMRFIRTLALFHTGSEALWGP